MKLKLKKLNKKEKFLYSQKSSYYFKGFMDGIDLTKSVLKRFKYPHGGWMQYLNEKFLEHIKKELKDLKK